MTITPMIPTPEIVVAQNRGHSADEMTARALTALENLAYTSSGAGVAAEDAFRCSDVARALSTAQRAEIDALRGSGAGEAESSATYHAHAVVTDAACAAAVLPLARIERAAWRQFDSARAEAEGITVAALQQRRSDDDARSDYSELWGEFR